MYHGAEEPEAALSQAPQGVFVTPAPQIAKQQGDLVSAYQLTGGEFLVPDMMGGVDPKVCKLIKKLHGPKTDCNRALYHLLASPTQQWVNALKTMGYSGFVNNDYMFVFDQGILRYLGLYDFNNRTVKRTT